MTIQDLQENIHTILENKSNFSETEKQLFSLYIENQSEHFKALVLKLNEFHNHDITHAMDAKQKQIWNICLGYIVGVVIEELESICNIKAEGNTVCD